MKKCLNDIGGIIPSFLHFYIFISFIPFISFISFIPFISHLTT